MDIQELRGKIDAIDDQLVKLFAQRMAVAAQIADYKKAVDSPFWMPGGSKKSWMRWPPKQALPWRPIPAICMRRSSA